ncbi:MAG: GH3 auxin-responsive promoter family protein [Oligoflexia bacterium]|nr:GH3 auxin-responsive promoter family protein [Oligoflexia bacterium]
MTGFWEKTLLSGIHSAYARSLRGAWVSFQRAAGNPERAQAEILKRILSSGARSRYGAEQGFGGLRSVEAFQKRVPIVDYDALEPWIGRVADGEEEVLTGAPVRMLERSGGSTATNKLIPYTDGLLAEFASATKPWLFDLFQSLPGLRGTRSYWALSPATRQAERTAGGLPVGFEQDTDYFDPVSRWALGKLMAVPSSVARIPDMGEWRRQTALALLAAGDLGLISVWNPSFLTLLMQAIAKEFDKLLSELPVARARELRSAVDARGFSGETLWPRLQLVSCWTDGIARDFLPGVRRWFPGTPIQGKGLLATEGVVSFPLWGREGSVLAVGGHFLEFIDLDQPARHPLLSHELALGGSYSPVLTTSGGLYRYHLKDIVECVGYYQRTPMVKFVEKLDAVGDLCGEKLHARQVDRGLEIACGTTGLRYEFALLAPVWGEPPHYRLYVETDAPVEKIERTARVLEDYLASGHHYSYCRKLGQLGPLSFRRVSDGLTIYQRTLVKEGLRAGEIKPSHLSRFAVWDEAFQAEAAMVEA